MTIESEILVNKLNLSTRQYKLGTDELLASA